MVTVYHARIKDSSRAEMTVTAHKRTVEAIKALGAELIPETKEEVSEAEIDGQGRYVPERGHS